MKPNNQQISLAKQLLVACEDDPLLAAAAVRAAKAQAKQVSEYRPNSDEIIVKVDSLSKSYKVGKQHIQALDGVSVDVHRGEFVAITGTSGSGKTTLLQLIGGLDKPSTGTVNVNGQNLAKLRDGKLSTFRNQTIGFVFQFFYLQPFLSLQTNVEVPAMFARSPRKERHARSAELAANVDLSDRLKHLPRELSGGQMQRAAIARALQNKPQLLLADEPTGNLDRTNAIAIFDLFRKIRDDQGTTVIVVTHDMELAANADRVISMRDGKVVA